MFSSNFLFEEFVARSLRTSKEMPFTSKERPFTKQRKAFYTVFLCSWWVTLVKNVYWNVSVGLKCVLISTTVSLMNLWPLHMLVSKKVTSVHDISPDNLIVGWCLFACSMNIFDDISAGVPEGDYVVNITFPS